MAKKCKKWRQIILAFLAGFFITWGMICVPAFSQVSPDVRNPHQLIEAGQKLYDAKQYSLAIAILQQAVAASQNTKDFLAQAIALSNLSLASKKLAQWDKAQYYITQSLNLLSNSQNIPDAKQRLPVLGQSLEVQANLQLELGKAQEALDTWKQAGNIYAQVNDEEGKIRSLINQTQAQQALGLYRPAHTTLKEIYPQLFKQPDSLLKATALRNFGDVLQLVGDLEQSQKILQQSLQIAKRLQSPPQISAALLSLGNTKRAFANKALSGSDTSNFAMYAPLTCVKKVISPSAAEFYQQAGQLYQEAATISIEEIEQIQAQLNQLSVFSELKQWSNVKKLALYLKNKLSKLPPSHTVIYAQINLAQNLVCLQAAKGADIPENQEIAQLLATAIQQARNIDDKRSQAYGLGALGALYLRNQDIPNAQKLTEQALKIAQTIQAADIAYLWQWQLGWILKIQADLPAAIAFYTEAVNSLKSLGKDLLALNPDLQFTFRDNVEPVYRQLVDVLLQPSPNTANQENLKQARQVIEALQLSELENFFREACLQAKPKQIDEVVDKIDVTAAVIYPIILPNRLEVILKLPRDSQLYQYTTYKSQSEVENILEKLQQNLREPDRIKDVEKSSQQIHSWLIEPMSAELKKAKIKTLVFVLDGYLRNIPMAALYDEKQKKYLIEKYAIALTPGLQLIDPKPLQRKQIDALIAGVSEKRQIENREFAPLVNVKQELNQIQSVVANTKQLLNQTFTKRNLQTQINSATYSVVHIATHGEFSSQLEETFIVTWEELLKIQDLDNLLRISNQQKSTPIELLVLSACQTAIGDKRATLGLAGTAVRAGTRSTLATLWSVDDRSTAELMNQFYQQLENSTLSKAEALRQAQLTLLANYKNPYFWAPYVLVGNWL